MADKYRDFIDLAAHTREGIDYRFTKTDRRSRVLIAAPHGGRVEPRSDKIAEAIAGLSHSLYVFHGLVRGLHVTSTHFNEPGALELAGRHAAVVAIHGCKDSRSKVTDVFVGGRDTNLRDAIIRELRQAGFSAAIDRRTAGCCVENLCNRGFSGAGTQLEMSRRLRTALTNQGPISRRRLRAFARAVGRGLRDRRPNPYQPSSRQ